MKTILKEQPYFTNSTGNIYHPVDGIPIGLEIMTRYVSAILTNQGVTPETYDNIIDRAKELTELTLEKWNDEVSKTPSILND